MAKSQMMTALRERLNAALRALSASSTPSPPPAAPPQEDHFAEIERLTGELHKHN